MEVWLAVRTDLYRTVRSVIRLVSRSYVRAIVGAVSWTIARARARTCNRYRLVLITRLEVWL